MAEASGPSSTPEADEYENVRAKKAATLKDLMKRRPGEKHYKRALRAYLEADGQFEKMLLKRLASMSNELADSGHSRLGAID